jgi:predicted small integral membrane protein
MFDTALLLAQTVATGGIAAWMFTGVRDNILYPSLNETFTAEVMQLDRMRIEYPAMHRMVAHRAVTNRRLQQWAFRSVVAAEVVACLLLVIGTAALVVALFGAASPATARGLALIGAAAFTSIWMGMLVVGNHFCYWFGHEGGQLTHYQMTLWGLGTILVLAV